MPDASARSTTRRVSIGRAFIDDDEPPAADRARSAIAARLGHGARRSGRSTDAAGCQCTEPITDALAGARTPAGLTIDDDDDDLCWRCHRPLLDED